MSDSLSINRLATYFGVAGEELFGWLHSVVDAEMRDCVAVICAPFGNEYTQSHRSLRHLSDELAVLGVPTFRFDYHGTGDSSGTDAEPLRLARWQSDIRASVAEARILSGRRKVCLIGLRLGATLAALAASEIDVDLLVLWNPYAKGRRFVREMQAIALTAEGNDNRVAPGDLECAGYLVSAETIAAIRDVDLATTSLAGRPRVLVLYRDDLSGEGDFVKTWGDSGVVVDEKWVPGWNTMMTDEHDSVVPREALRAIIDWVRCHSSSLEPERFADSSPTGRAARLQTRMPVTPAHVEPLVESGKVTIKEQVVRYGKRWSHFGIFSGPAQDVARDGPVVVMINSGSVHHVGPHRVYVELARALAGCGISCFRFDLEGLGDSVQTGDGLENHPYRSDAVDSVRLALGALKEQFGRSRFVLTGICSGAHHVFHSGLATKNDEVVGLILINPLTFYWREGTRLSARQFIDARRYRDSVRDPRRWLKLLSFRVNLRRPIEVTLGQARILARSIRDSYLERFAPDRGPRLSRDLRALIGTERLIALVVSEGDPGLEILMAGARHTAKRALKSGRIKHVPIAGADHTFSPRHTRIALARSLLSLLDHLASYAQTARSGNPNEKLPGPR